MCDPTKLTLPQLQEIVAADAKAHGWFDDEHGELALSDAYEHLMGRPMEVDLIARDLMLVVGELSEAIQELRSGKGVRETYTSDGGKPEGVPTEIADALIRLLNVCTRYNIDLAGALAAKVEYNKQRDHRHGGRVY